MLDVLHVYYEEDHRMRNTWLALTAPHSSRRRAGGGVHKGGIQGYLRLSMALLGPGDPPLIWDEYEAEAEGGGEGGGSILMPPTIKRELAFLEV